MKLALAQYSLDTDVQRNLEKVTNLMRDAARVKADLVLFPELSLSPFFPQYAGREASHYAMRSDHDCVEALKQCSRRLGLFASPNVYLQEGSHRFDASLMIDRAGDILGISKMVHIAQLPGFYEKDYYAPSDTGFKVYDTVLGKIGIVVCFDRHFPESIRTCTVRGATLILIPTANTVGEPLDLFECELRAAALQNGVYLAMCNRVGREGEAQFCGESIVVSSDGDTLFKAGDEEGLFTVDIDLAHVAESRQKRPYLSLRRPELYE